MKKYVPNEKIIDGCCKVWVSVLRDPKFDALGNDPEVRAVDDPNG